MTMQIKKSKVFLMPPDSNSVCILNRSLETDHLNESLGIEGQSCADHCKWKCNQLSSSHSDTHLVKDRAWGQSYNSQVVFRIICSCLPYNLRLWIIGNLLWNHHWSNHLVNMRGLLNLFRISVRGLEIIIWVRGEVWLVTTIATVINNHVSTYNW